MATMDVTTGKKYVVLKNPIALSLLFKRMARNMDMKRERGTTSTTYHRVLPSA